MHLFYVILYNELFLYFIISGLIVLLIVVIKNRKISFSFYNFNLLILN